MAEERGGLKRRWLGEDAMISGMESFHISEADAVGDGPVRRSISECIALAEAHERESGLAPVLDADFAADVEEIVRSRKRRDFRNWD